MRWRLCSDGIGGGGGGGGPGAGRGSGGGFAGAGATLRRAWRNGQASPCAQWPLAQNLHSTSDFTGVQTFSCENLHAAPAEHWPIW